MELAPFGCEEAARFAGRSLRSRGGALALLPLRQIAILKYSAVPEWRNWQTRRTQNPVHRKVSVGSTPSSGTIPRFARSDCRKNGSGMRRATSRGGMHDPP
jgi:hypothetical protein